MQPARSPTERRFVLKDGVRAPMSRRVRMRNALRRNGQTAKERVVGLLEGGKALGAPFRAVGRRLLAKERATPTVYLLLLMTTCYLLVESAFAAWLIDVMGAYSDQSTIERAEHYGRLISGFAVALLFWPWMLKRRSWLNRIAWLSVGTFFIMGLVYNAERRLIVHLVDTSDAQARAAANVGVLLRSALVTEQVKNDMLDGIWSAKTAQSSPGKAFAGISAFLVARSESAREQTMDIAPQVIRGVIDAQMGGPLVELGRYASSQDAVKKKFERYEALHKHYQEARGQAATFADIAWKDYLNELKRKNASWGSGYKSNDGSLVPRRAIEPTRRAVRAKGIPVPKNWNTGDRATFVSLVRKQHEKKALEALEAQLNGIPKGMGLTAFANHSSIQNPWRDTLGYPKSLGILPISKLTEDQFRKQLYDPTIAHRAKTLLASYQSAIPGYREGGPHAEAGRAAYEAMIAPVFALTLSLLGALVHLCKVLLLALHATTGRHFQHSSVKTVVIASIVTLALVGSSLFVTTTVTSHRTYRNWVTADSEISIDKIDALSEVAIGLALDSVIKGQSLAYPVFNYVRTGLAPLADSAHGRELLAMLDNQKSDK